MEQTRAALPALRPPRPVAARPMMAAMPQTMPEMERLAIAMARSGFFEDAKEAPKALVKMIYGAEFGLGPAAAMSGVHIIKGKPTMAATTIAGVIKKSGIYDYRVVERSDSCCVLDFFENGEQSGSVRFDMADAARAGLAGGENWKKYPRAMLFSRAMTEGARAYCPDVFGGAVYAPEELSDRVRMDSQGNVLGVPQDAIAGDASDLPAAAAAAAAPSQAAPTIKELTDLFAVAKTTLPAGNEPLKLGVWLEMTGIAPGLRERIDEITGKNTGLTEAEALEAKRQLAALICERLPDEAAKLGLKATAQAIAPEFVVGEDEEAPPPPSADDAPPPIPPGDAPVGAPGISDAQRTRIQAMFAERKFGLRAWCAANGVKIAATTKAAKMDEICRHAFAAHVLENELKGSSKQWSGLDYKRVSDRLELIPPDPEPADGGQGTLL